jgi:hypothetical protein
MEIIAKTKLSELLDVFPKLEEKIIMAAPAFRNLRNPVLRRTVGKIATVENVVQIGGLDLTTFINLLRREVGQPELLQDETNVPEKTQPSANQLPDWVTGEPQFTVDGINLIASGEVPVNKVNALLPQLDTGRYILLITDFEPTPMLDALRKQNRNTFHQADIENTGRNYTYIR